MRVFDGVPIEEGKCRECNRWLELEDGVLPRHDQLLYLPRTGVTVVCPGSKREPVEVRT